jgi:membrane protein YqaA with SNARE-associated domain
MARALERPRVYERLVQHATSGAALGVAFLWGLAEATFFFIVPDVYLGLVALLHWRRGLWATAAAVAGALAGGALMFSLAAANPGALEQFLLRIPGISAPMVQAVAEQIGASGLWALVSGPLGGVPYKIYAVQAGTQHLSLPLFLLVTIPARLERLLPVSLAAGLAGVWLRPRIERQPVWAVGLYALLWVVIYVLYYAALA